MGLFDVKKKGLGFLSVTAPQCRACPRTKNPIEVAGYGNHKILVVVDEPSESESYSKKAFVGDKYEEIEEILAQKGLSFHQDCWKIHAAACYDEEEKTMEKAVDCCNPHFLDVVKSLKPKVIIALGGSSNRALLGNRFSDSSVGRWRGIPIFHPELECWMVCTYDPSWSNDARTYDSYRMIIEADIDLALKHLNKKAPKKLNPKIITCTDFSDVCFELELLLERAEEVALDYETTGLKPANKGHRIVANSFTYVYSGGRKMRTISYPIAYKGHFSKKQRRIIKDLTRKILVSDIPKIGHHAKFEDVWGNVYLKTPTNNWIWCTMYTAHLLDERPNHVSLKTQAFIHFQAEPYEEKTKNYLKSPEGSGANGFNNVDKCPLLDLLYYNGLDTYYTYLLYRRQKKIIQNDPALAPITQLFLEGALLFSDMEQAGFGIIPNYFEEKDLEIAKLIKEKKREILATEEAKKFNKIMRVPFSFGKDSHIDAMIYRVLKTEEFKKTTSGKRAKDNEVLAFLEKQGSLWAKGYSDYSRLRKAKDTFVAQFLLEKNEKNTVNTLYNLAGTRTSRPSGAAPNMLNIPKRNKFIMNLIRGGIKAPFPGHCFCEADYGSLEVRVAACYTRDPVLINYILDPKSDMHRDSATDLFFMPADKVSKMARFFAKNGFVFANFYGSSAKSAARNLWKNLPEIFDTDNVSAFQYLEENDIYDYKDFEEHIIGVQEAFWKKFKVFKQWQLDTVKGYYDRGYIESKIGFRRRGVLGYNEIINTNIQGSAFTFLLWSCIQVNNISKKECWKSRVIGQIYDSMLSSVHPDEKDHVTQTIRYVMEEKVRERFPWICVPMVAEFEITEPDGTWNTLKELKVEYDKKFHKW